MADWQSMWLGRRSWSRDLSGFKIEAIVAFSGAERRVVEERLGLVLKTARALQMGFLRLTGDCKSGRTDRRPECRSSVRSAPSGAGAGSPSRTRSAAAGCCPRKQRLSRRNISRQRGGVVHSDMLSTSFFRRRCTVISRAYEMYTRYQASRLKSASAPEGGRARLPGHRSLLHDRDCGQGRRKTRRSIPPNEGMTRTEGPCIHLHEACGLLNEEHDHCQHRPFSQCPNSLLPPFAHFRGPGAASARHLWASIASRRAFP